MPPSSDLFTVDCFPFQVNYWQKLNDISLGKRESERAREREREKENP